MNDLNGVACHLGDKSIDFVGTEAVVAPAVVVATPATPVEAYRKLHHRLRFPVPPTLLLLLLLLLLHHSNHFFSNISFDSGATMERMKQRTTTPATPTTLAAPGHVATASLFNRVDYICKIRKKKSNPISEAARFSCHFNAPIQITKCPSNQIK